MLNALKQAQSKEEQFDIAIDYLRKIIQSELFTEDEYFEEFQTCKFESNLTVENAIGMIEHFSGILEYQDGLKLQESIHKTMVSLCRNFCLRNNRYNNAQFAEILAFILIKAQQLSYIVNVKEEFTEYLKILRDVELKQIEERERINKRRTEETDWDQDDYADAVNEYNLHMDWQEGEIDDDEYFNKLSGRAYRDLY